jgi:uncharacterized protein
MAWRFGAVATALALVLWLWPAVADPTFPELTGRVVDDAGILSDAEEQAIGVELKALEDKSSDQLVMVTVPSLQGYAIEHYGHLLGRHWGLGTAKLDNGVLLIVAPNERRVRIEVGYGLEGTLTDALSSIIVQHAILPRFRDGDFPAGIKDGVRDIILVLTGDAAEVEERAKARQDASGPAIDWLFMILWFAIWAWVVYSIWRHARHGAARRGKGGGSIFAPGSTWSSGGGSGGGFSGGGGSFGGGGASGGW